MSLDRQPTLRGNTINLRPLTAADWDKLYAVAANPKVWAMHPMHDRWQEEVFREFFDDALAKGGALAAIDRASGDIIGSSRFQAYDPADGGSVEIGWTFLDPHYWGTGANREMKRLMVDHALASVARVDFRVGEANWRSRRALEKIGAQLSPDRIERAVLPGIGEAVHLYYEMTRLDYERILAKG
ncbi:GNAT family N-acetyltransferase [Aurantiacibacter sp. MUD61]|uniref:GNAT family N-acetyltransferase n=1 Tax=Aurantiacibacter sp. MUD61 TaxID=3009083 RepID=UPI0022F10ABD|nr:GNAT family N-acetyltransferase [Aurantiacibacter sp. MUD61]